MTVLVVSTLDTKGSEAAFIRDRLRDLGVSTLLMDTGCAGRATIPPDIDRYSVFAAAGENCDSLRELGDRGKAVAAAARGAAKVAESLFAEGKIDGVIAIGGSAGTTIGTSAMRALPLGVPKLMVSTLASGQVRPYVRDKDILMMNSVVDISGINRISRIVLSNAAAAMAGTIQFRHEVKLAEDKSLVAATMFGVTTPCVEHARRILEHAGYEVLVFHATGNGGMAMESLIREGLIAGVLDITTTELADELVGGVLSAGPTRLTAAAEMGIPQVVSVGATDMVNFGPPETVPQKFSGRLFHEHNPTVTLMRTTADENREIGRDIANKLRSAKGRATIVLPLHGVSAIDRQGQPFEDQSAREALFGAIRQHAGSIEIIERENHINDADFAEAAVEELLELMAFQKASLSS